MLKIRYRVESRTEHRHDFCTVGLVFVDRGESGVPDSNPEFKLTLPMSQWETYPVGAEFDLVPARTRT